METRALDDITPFSNINLIVSHTNGFETWNLDQWWVYTSMRHKCLLLAPCRLLSEARTVYPSWSHAHSPQVSANHHCFAVVRPLSQRHTMLLYVTLWCRSVVVSDVIELSVIVRVGSKILLRRPPCKDLNLASSATLLTIHVVQLGGWYTEAGAAVLLPVDKKTSKS